MIITTTTIIIVTIIVIIITTVAQGNMRFMPPKNPKEQWTKIRAAVAQQPSCPQLIRNHPRRQQQDHDNDDDDNDNDDNDNGNERDYQQNNGGGGGGSGSGGGGRRGGGGGGGGGRVPENLRNITPFLTEQIEDCLTLNLYVPIPSE